MKTKINYLLILVLAGFVLTGCCSMKQCGSCKAQQWEYKTIYLRSDGNGHMVEDKLNTIGKDGWSLVSVVDSSSQMGGGQMEGGFFYFKRPIQ